ncbi:hypothetical protein COX99_03165 [Candidatus Pacearchaeota archaeon CG_4_10_14_0_2_um_filter_31_10]|nr:MAG: hypothetical protein COU55_02400 [Candidatus Pacearchaeota archaeon CG10_big_fil_rev_8_21_14_0_10_31_59]PIZ80038.1 MAG: hypothetical protein COX99_03165 [Candidatus Pacearchaeota archaeon CG_4_10_14_0_2_um_filter_31_10]
MIFPEISPIIIYVMLFISLFIACFYLLLLLKKEEMTEPLMEKKDVSFVIPAKNVAKYIEQCINTILNQDYEGNINLVIVNDGSTDNTKSIVEEIIKKTKLSKRKIILLNRESQGKKVFAVNFGLRYVIKELKSEYVCVLDADTFIQKDSISKMLPKLNDKTMCVIAPIVPYNRNKILAKLQLIEYIVTFFYRDLISKVKALCVSPAFSVFKTEFFVKHGLYDEDNLTEDFEIALRIKKYGYDVDFVNNKCYTIVPETLRELKTQRVRWGYGTIDNFMKYRKLVSFRRGMFGTFFLPVNLVLGLLVLMAAFFLIIYNLAAFLNNAIYLLSIGWKPIFEWNITFFKIALIFSDPRLILILLSVIISFFFLYYSYKQQGEKVNLIHYFIFLFIYSLFLAYVHIEGIIRYIFKIKTNW